MTKAHGVVMFIWEVELVTVLFWELFGARVDCSLGFFR